MLERAHSWQLATNAMGRARLLPARRWLSLLCLVLTWGSVDLAAAQRPSASAPLGPLRFHSATPECALRVTERKVREFFATPTWVFERKSRTRWKRDNLDLLQQCCWRATAASNLSSSRIGQLCSIANATGDPVYSRHCKYHKVRDEKVLRRGTYVSGQGYQPDPVAQGCGAFASTCTESNVCRTGKRRWSGELKGPFVLGRCPIDVSVSCGGGGKVTKPRLPPLQDVICALKARNGDFLRHQNFVARVTPIHSPLDRADAQFKVVPGLKSSWQVSFESLNFPGFFLRMTGDAKTGYVKLERHRDDADFRLGASVIVERAWRDFAFGHGYVSSAPNIKQLTFLTARSRNLLCVKEKGRLGFDPKCGRDQRSFELLCGDKNPFRKK